MDSAETAPQVHEPITPESAIELVDTLTPRDQDLLGLVALGLPMQEVASRLNYAEATIKGRAGEMYSTLGVERRAGASEIAWGAKLLEWAYLSGNGDLAYSKEVLHEQELGLSQIRIMNYFGLTLKNFTILELTAARQTNKQIGKRLSLEETTIKSHKTALYGRLGQEKKSQAIKMLAGLGRIAVAENTPAGV